MGQLALKANALEQFWCHTPVVMSGVGLGDEVVHLAASVCKYQSTQHAEGIIQSTGVNFDRSLKEELDGRNHKAKDPI